VERISQTAVDRRLDEVDGAAATRNTTHAAARAHAAAARRAAAARVVARKAGRL